MNRLSESMSPYLLQHAGNPVEWYPWGELALQEAKSQNKPIFLSIGYAACHWCHVMARESFEDLETAAMMNTHFINIKVDREERPDLDSIYMAAAVAMTGSGGWPLSVFLTPDLKPFYCGTYFPPQRRFNLPSFREILMSIANAWEKEEDNILTIGERVVDHIRGDDQPPPPSPTLDRKVLDTAARNLMQSFDWAYGGWGQAPKFPQPMSIDFLLTRQDEEIKAAAHTLSCMARGGMYDVVGGGFSRYSTDLHWRVPHFEKMLYDNAQLAQSYLCAWLVTGNPEMKRIAEETLGFISRELTSPEGGFYSSLDADSEHEEGKYYVWSYREIESLLGEDFEFFKAAYGLTENGNWEGKIVLQRALDDGTLSFKFGSSSTANPPDGWVREKLADCHARLFTERTKRIRPGMDDKVLVSWNAFTLSAFAYAARAFHGTEMGEGYLRIASKNTEFLLTHMIKGNRLHRVWHAGKTGREVFLEDYAALILALLDLYQADFNNTWFTKALELTETLLELFNDPSGGFFDTPKDGEELIFRPKDLQDNATPCGNSLASEALLRLAALTGRPDFRQKAEETLRMLSTQAANHPLGYSRWLSALDFLLADVKQIAVVGGSDSAETKSLMSVLQGGYHPHWVIATSPLPLPDKVPELLYDRPMLNGKPTAYVCEGFICKQPVTDADALRKLLSQ